MLKEIVFEDEPNDEELTERLEKARLELAKRQVLVKEKKIPIIGKNIVNVLSTTL